MRIQVSESTFEASEFHTCQFSESNKKLRAKLLELLHFLWKELAVGFTIHNGGRANLEWEQTMLKPLMTLKVGLYSIAHAIGSSLKSVMIKLRVFHF